MFAETEGSRKAIGDVDVVYHEGLYHLFHLVLPNHDFIAHAVSTNGVNWRRVGNAVFIGDPGSWDDLMLWTMHVTPDPYQRGRWRMFYTGLSRREQGHIQRIGLAVSEDLYHWHKMPVSWQDHRGPSDPELVKQARRMSHSDQPSRFHAKYDEQSGFPLSPDGRYYESRLDEGRHWISFRDPFYYHEDGEGWLIASARTKQGPVVRRGCVAVLKETRPHIFEALPPLHHPGLYDDIEVPNLIRLQDEYYLIGSIREDAKIRYWHTDQIGHPWRSYYDNVLMPSGNYAGRVCRDDHGWLLWNFFSMNLADRTAHNLMPPPKRLIRTEDGLLRATTFEGFDEWLDEPVDTRRIHALKQDGRTHQFRCDDACVELESEAGFQAFVFDDVMRSFQFQGSFQLRGKGKCGIVFRIDPATHDGYYLSLDMLKGLAQLRSWKTGPDGSGEKMMQFETLQSGCWYAETPGKAHVRLLAFGSYLEFSINGQVILSLADQGFSQGLVGLYLESARMQLADVQLQRMQTTGQSDDHLTSG
jgi:beta-fructofuranosidase